MSRSKRLADVRLGSILLKKSFLADERNFSAPLVRPARGDVRDHIDSYKSDRRSSYLSYSGLQRRKQRNTDLREIFGAAQFSTFSTVSVKLRRTQYEHIFSALPSNSDIARRSRYVSNVPSPEVS